MENDSTVGSLAIRFFDNEVGLGFLINQPEFEPLICLNRTLLGEVPTSPLFQTVYQALLEYYHSLNMWEFVFPFRRFYEELAAQVPVKDEIIIWGRFKRYEAPCKVCEAKLLGYRLIG
jgi:hypothetical protein